MSYQVYFSEMKEATLSLTLAILQLKEESGKLESDERSLLDQIRGSESSPPVARRRRRASNGHAEPPPGPPPEESASASEESASASEESASE